MKTTITEHNVLRIPQPNDVYKYYITGLLYTIIAIAKDVKTDETMVVYRLLYDGDEIAYVEPISEFMGAVDKSIYPNSKQHYRYEFVRGGYQK